MRRLIWVFVGRTCRKVRLLMLAYGSCILSPIDGKLIDIWGTDYRFRSEFKTRHIARITCRPHYRKLDQNGRELRIPSSACLFTQSGHGYWCRFYNFESFLWQLSKRFGHTSQPCKRIRALAVRICAMRSLLRDGAPACTYKSADRYCWMESWLLPHRA